MKFARAFLAALLMGTSVLAAQNSADAHSTDAPSAAPHSSTAVIAGVVSKLPGGDPVKKALIELIAESQNDGGNYTVLTSADGSFRIEHILPGRYRLFIEKTGYQEIDSRRHPIEGRALTLAASREINDLAIHLQAAAIIEGRVTDEDGEAIAGAQVTVLRKTSGLGRRSETAGSERTNDLGEYRISGLAPGSYFVLVTPPPDLRNLIESTNSAAVNAPRAAVADKSPPLSYQTTYYPGTRDRSQAGAIQLHAGDDFPVNFSLTPSLSFAVRGSVVGLPAGATAAIILWSKDFGATLNGAEIRPDGTFEIRDISPGAYTIFATVENAPGTMTARQSLQLASTNVEGLRLGLQPGGSVSGHIRIEGAASNAVKLDSGQIFLALRSAEEDDDMPAGSVINEAASPARVNPDGSFEWMNVPAGRYFVEISESTALPDLFLKSALSSGRDVSSEFTVSGDGKMLDLVASVNGPMIDGVVTGPKKSASDSTEIAQPGAMLAGDQSKTQTENAGTDSFRWEDVQAAADAVIVAVPEARFRGRPDHYRKAVADQRGHFTLHGLVPGEYTIFAWEHIDGEAYLDPEFLRAYEGQGKALHLNAGDQVTLQLKAISIAEDQP
jgi:hypothetical protein